MLVIADRRLTDAVVMQQFPRLACVLAGDGISLLKHAQRTQRDVFQVADRSRDEVERAGHALRVTLADTDSDPGGCKVTWRAVISGAPRWVTPGTNSRAAHNSAE